MVQKSTQKSRNKAAIKKSAPVSKKDKKKQPTESAPLSNGDIEETQNNNIENSVGVSGSHSEMEVGQSENVDTNEENSNTVESVTVSNSAEQPVENQENNSAENASEGTSVIEKENEKSTRPVNKSKRRQQKDNPNQMEADEEQVTELEEDSAPRRTTSRKRKLPELSEPEEAKEPKVAREDNTTAGGEVDEAIEENVGEPVVQASKSRSKRIPKTTKMETAKTKSVQKKKTTSATKVKTKRQKVCLNIPPLQTISGKVFVIGENDVGQLGFGEEVEVKKRPAVLELPYSVVDIAAGGMHSVCLTESGEVITFGCNDEGALGRITSDEGSECTPRKVEIPERVTQISAGDSHSAALTESGKVYLWGNFRSGDGPMGLTADGAKQTKPIRILTNLTIVKISSGTEHLACLSNEGIVYTCGCGENGQLGRLAERACRDGGRKGRSALLDPAEVPIANRTRTVLIEDVWCGSYTTFLKAQETGLIYAFGLNNYNHLGYTNERVRFTPKQVSSFNNRSWLQITGGQHHTLALDNENLVFALGRKEYGRLGLGEDCEEKPVPTIIPTLENEKCSNISCGNCVSFAITEEGTAYSWGMGTNHQLGHGNDDDCHVPHRIEGSFMSSWKAIKISGGGQHTLILASPKLS